MEEKIYKTIEGGKACWAYDLQILQSGSAFLLAELFPESF